MFVCRGCLRRLAGTAVTSPHGPRLFSSSWTGPATASRGRPYRPTGVKVDLQSAPPAYSNNAHQELRSELGKVAPAEKRSLIDDHNNEEVGYEHLSAKAGQFEKDKYERKLQSGLKRSLELTPDPFHIAQHVSAMLEKEKFDEALMMTRMASRNTKVEVSWNHLIDYLMKNKRLHASIKLYNEMKKRSQIPNAKTYTIIFRGCSQSLHPKLAVAEATRIYNSMIQQGPLKPNTIHLNAVLDVCARAGDMESLFTILATANGSIRLPDAHTYTIVLNALRHDSGTTSNANFGLVDSDVKREVQKNIQRASGIWADAIANWRGAKMILDEHAVCAMGRLLTTGNYKDNESVLELLEQTMQIPRFDKPNPQLPTAPNGAPTPKGESVAAVLPVRKPVPQQTLDTRDMSPAARRDLARSTTNSYPLYAKPGVRTISLVLAALANLRKTGSAPKYWSYLTDTLGIKPDPDNHFNYLRVLALGHASAQVADLITALPRDLLSPVTFRRGFSACISDNLNPGAFRNACHIFNLMTKTQRYPDALAMRLYLQAARANTRHFYEQPHGSANFPDSVPDASPPTATPEDLAAHGAQIVEALDHMWEPFHILSRSMSYPSHQSESPEAELEKKRGEMQEIMSTARRMIAAIDRVVIGGLVTEKLTIRELRTRRAVLQRNLERWIMKLFPKGAPADVWKAVDEEERADSTRYR